MGRTPCCDKSKVKKGPWSPEEDETLKNYMEKHGTGGNWISLPLKAGLKRCGKSCRLRWLNYLRPDIKHGAFAEEEDEIICSLYGKMGSRWSIIASHLPGRTDNDVKNHWNTKLKKKLLAAANTNSTIDNNNINIDAAAAAAENKPLFDSSTCSMLSLTSPKMPFLTDDELKAMMFNEENISAYDPTYNLSLPRSCGASRFSTSTNNFCNFSPSQEGSTISGSSSSLAMENNYTRPWPDNGGLDISHGYPYELLMGGLWSQEAAFEALPANTSFASSYNASTNLC